MQQSKGRILIVENDEDTLFLIGHALTEAGYIVETCTGGSGIVEFKHETPHLFILDQGLPMIDGIALSKFLRLQQSTKAIPIIMISGHHIENKAAQAGVDHFIRKPFSIRHLVDVVNRHTQNAGRRMYSQ